MSVLKNLQERIKSKNSFVKEVKLANTGMRCIIGLTKALLMVGLEPVSIDTYTKLHKRVKRSGLSESRLE